MPLDFVASAAPTALIRRAWAAVLLTLSILLAVPAQANPPNVVVIVADDLGYADVGFNGGTQIKTPNIDGLAAEGTVFTSGYATASVCSPSRAGIMTGRYGERFGYESNIPPNALTVGLPLDEKTIAEVMKSSGYATGLIGKWHLGKAPGMLPNQRGFDSFYGFLDGTSRYLSPVTLKRNTATVTENRYATTAYGAEAATFITAHRNQPFFLYLAFNAPHLPLQATQALLNRYPNLSGHRRTFAAMVSGMDDAVGVVRQALVRNGLDDQTLIFFLSDNGGALDAGATNMPLRGSKAQTLEGGVRVPFFMRWPGHISAGGRFAGAVSALDILPTAAAAGRAARPPKPLDGVNLMPFLASGSGVPHPHLYWRMDTGTAKARSGALSGQLKLEKTQSSTAIYDLATDLHENRNILTAPLLQQMMTSYDAWNAQMVAPKWPSP